MPEANFSIKIALDQSEVDKMMDKIYGGPSTRRRRKATDNTGTDDSNTKAAEKKQKEEEKKKIEADKKRDEQRRKVYGTISNFAGPIAALTGISVGIGSLVDNTVKSSPLLREQLHMMQVATQIYFRPFGEFLGSILRPMAIQMLKFAIRWNTDYTAKAAALGEDLGEAGEEIANDPLGHIGDWIQGITDGLRNIPNIQLSGDNISIIGDAYASGDANIIELPWEGDTTLDDLKASLDAGFAAMIAEAQVAKDHAATVGLATTIEQLAELLRSGEIDFDTYKTAVDYMTESVKGWADTVGKFTTKMEAAGITVASALEYGAGLIWNPEGTFTQLNAPPEDTPNIEEDITTAVAPVVEVIQEEIRVISDLDRRIAEATVGLWTQHEEAVGVGDARGAAEIRSEIEDITQRIRDDYAAEQQILLSQPEPTSTVPSFEDAYSIASDSIRDEIKSGNSTLHSALDNMPVDIANALSIYLQGEDLSGNRQQADTELHNMLYEYFGTGETKDQLLWEILDAFKSGALEYIDGALTASLQGVSEQDILLESLGPVIEQFQHYTNEVARLGDVHVGSSPIPTDEEVEQGLRAPGERFSPTYNRTDEYTLALQGQIESLDTLTQIIHANQDSFRNQAERAVAAEIIKTNEAIKEGLKVDTDNQFILDSINDINQDMSSKLTTLANDMSTLVVKTRAFGGIGNDRTVFADRHFGSHATTEERRELTQPQLFRRDQEEQRADIAAEGNRQFELDLISGIRQGHVTIQDLLDAGIRGMDAAYREAVDQLGGILNVGEQLGADIVKAIVDNMEHGVFGSNTESRDVEKQFGGQYIVIDPNDLSSISGVIGGDTGNRGPSGREEFISLGHDIGLEALKLVHDTLPNIVDESAVNILQPIADKYQQFLETGLLQIDDLRQLFSTIRDSGIFDDVSYENRYGAAGSTIADTGNIQANTYQFPQGFFELSEPLTVLSDNSQTELEHLTRIAEDDTKIAISTEKTANHTYNIANNTNGIPEITTTIHNVD
ncbi:MAG: hypothetical protein F4Z07_11100, partial [Dehalococcoidia bacterium]|nr:hypothetical protein [Dehalococcoidia bacterium]